MKTYIKVVNNFIISAYNFETENTPKKFSKI